MSSENNLTRDIVSGFLVFLIALPLCLGISIASGFPPIAGIMTAIVGGITSIYWGVSKFTIKGPAAGLIVIAIGAVTELGQGDMMYGYRCALAVGVIAASFQILFALLRLANFGMAICPSVVEGMLAAIGVIIISKQAHVALGVTPTAKAPLGLLAEIPNSLVHANPIIALIGALSLIILIGMPLLKIKALKKVPAPLVVLLATVPIGLYYNIGTEHSYALGGQSYQLGAKYLVQLPGSILSAITFPDFSQITSAVSIKYIVMFALVGSIESVLSVLAVDSMAPEKKASDLNKDLLAVGIGNLVASLIGGLPMISEIVRSRANIDAGAQSRWSNFSHGMFLLVFVSAIPGLLGNIPLAALAAMLVFVGLRLAGPVHFRHAKELGADQFMYFLVTLTVTLMSDLLIGVATGLVLNVIVLKFRGSPFKSMLGSGVEVTEDGKVLKFTIHGAATFASLMAVRKALEHMSETIELVEFDLSDSALLDHTFRTRIVEISEEWSKAKLSFVGMEGLDPCSKHPCATAWRH